MRIFRLSTLAVLLFVTLNALGSSFLGLSPLESHWGKRRPLHPRRLHVIRMNPSLDATKPLAQADHAGFVYRSGILVGATDKFTLQAYGVPTKKVLWTANIVGGTSAPILSFGEWLYVPFGNGTVAKLELQSGAPVWQSHLPVFSNRPLAKDQNYLYVVSAREILYALDLQRGVVKWLFDPELKQGPVLRNAAAPVKNQGYVYLGLSSGEIAKIDVRNGALVWRTESNTAVGALHDVVGRMAVYDDRLYFCRSDGFVGALYIRGPKESQLAWKSPISLGSCTDTDLRDGRFYVSRLTGGLESYDIHTGTLVWQENLHRPITHFVAGEAKIFATTSNGWIQFISKTGVLEWEDRVGASISVKPLFVGSDVYVSTGYKNLYGYSLRN